MKISKILYKSREELKRYHKGDVAFETIILTPLVMVTFLMILFFFFMSLTYISYNNLANTIAKELDMRQTGYKTAMTTNTSIPEIWTYRNATSGSIPSGRTLKDTDITINDDDNPALRAGLYAAMKKYKNQFTVPFSEITHINVKTSKDINVDMGHEMAGTVISVEIKYTTMTYGEPGHGLIPMSARGYNIIS